MKEAFTHKSLLILGRGIGQVMFQNNALSGLLMLIGIFLNSWQMGLLAVSGNIISTSTGRISGYDRDDIKNGLYGFNGTLVGIAVGGLYASDCKFLDTNGYCLVCIYLHCTVFQHATHVARIHYPFYPFCMDAAGIVQLADA